MVNTVLCMPFVVQNTWLQFLIHYLIDERIGEELFIK